MGVTAENVAQKFQITRDQQDEFALGSQQKASAAQKAGKFKDEIVPVTIKTRKGDVVVSDDEFIRHDATLDGLKKLRPAFNKEGTVTAGNASGINDGAAVLIVMSAAEAEKRGLKPLARIASFATAGVDPAIMGTGPIPASRKALERAGWKIGDLDLIEANEAFAAQACAVNKELGWDTVQGQRQRRRDRAWPPDRRLGRAHPDDPPLRDAEARRQERPRHPLRRRRHGRGDVRRALSAQSWALAILQPQKRSIGMADNENPAAAASKMGEAVASQFANAASVYGGAFAGSFKALQEYQPKLLHLVQENATANMQFAQKLMQPRSPSEFVEFLSTHMRERADCHHRSGEGTRRARTGSGEEGCGVAHAAEELSERAQKIRRPAAPTAGRSRFDQAAAHCSASRIS